VWSRESTVPCRDRRSPLALAFRQQGPYQTKSATAEKPLPPDAPPEVIFKHLSTSIELEIFDESNPNQRRVILDHAVQRYRRILDKRSYNYDDPFVVGAPAEQIFKALADVALLDSFNEASAAMQRCVIRQSFVQFIELRLGIALTQEQAQRVVRDKEEQDFEKQHEPAR
jgi:hypothetical protein